MKPLTLDKTWELCLEMWKWVVKEWRRNKNQDIDALKKQWLASNKLKGLIDDCFFCQYDGEGMEGECQNCPGVLIDPYFFCCGTSEYHYYSFPDKFYKKLLELNRKRKKK